MLKTTRDISEKFHMLIHLVIGVSIGLLFVKFQDVGLSITFLFLMGMASLIPDLEHFVFFFTYGRKSTYTKDLLKQLKLDGIVRGFWGYCSRNHKKQNALYLHDGLTPVIFLMIGFLLLDKSKNYQAALIFSLAFHYIYDIFEDFLMMGSLNPNWKRGTKTIKGIITNRLKRKK